MAEKYTFNELCRTTGRPPAYIRSLQIALDLHIPDKKSGYPPAYLYFMEKVVALRVLSVKVDDISDLFRKERKILELLNVDCLSESDTWYLDSCGTVSDRPDRRLLLTDHDLGFPLNAHAVQSNLDFGGKAPELFKAEEMGEDVRHVLKTYLRQLEKIREKARAEEEVLRNALAWAAQAFGENNVTG
ncbi:MAG TPA: hypothetical protein PLE77_01650 [Kiritimatiellia bacterium]|nr:hypothetical protein [Kiritimatiellia bacterium]